MSPLSITCLARLKVAGYFKEKNDIPNHLVGISKECLLTINSENFGMVTNVIILQDFNFVFSLSNAHVSLSILALLLDISQRLVWLQLVGWSEFGAFLHHLFYYIAVFIELLCLIGITGGGHVGLSLTIW